ncbi:MAG: isoaspartyl peptidase/L-asparaginase [Planctomycetota bacterium]
MTRTLVLLIACVIPSIQSWHGTEAFGESWSIALHGGAGSLPKDMPAERRTEYQEALESCLAVGVTVLERGGSALDAVEQTVMALEDCPLFNAGRGAVFDETGGHALDASIMDGSTMACGGVTGVKALRNPIQGARAVMEHTRYVLLSGRQAEQIAARHGATLASPNYFSTRGRFGVLREVMEESGRTPPATPLYGWPVGESGDADASLEQGKPGETVGCVARDSNGRLAAATSTGGLSGKPISRIGDSPIIGAGTYANRFVAASGTGSGEEYIRNAVAARVAILVEHRVLSLDKACEHVLGSVLKPGDGGLIAISQDGAISMRANTGSMPSAAADADGRREIKLFYD